LSVKNTPISPTRSVPGQYVISKIKNRIIIIADFLYEKVNSYRATLHLDGKIKIKKIMWNKDILLNN